MTPLTSTQTSIMMSTSLRIQRHPSQLSTCAHTSEERTRSIQRTHAQNGCPANNSQPVTRRDRLHMHLCAVPTVPTRQRNGKEKGVGAVTWRVRDWPSDSSHKTTNKTKVSLYGISSVVTCLTLRCLADQELSQRSSNAVVAAVLKLPTISMALMDKHLRPMAKLLGVPRYASKDKNWLVVELASRLVARKWVALHGDKRQLCREDIVVARYF